MRRRRDQSNSVRFLDRLPALILLGLGLSGLGLVGCDDKKPDAPSATRSRSQSVVVSASPSVGVPASATAQPGPTLTKKRVLCAGQLGAPGRAVPEAEFERTAAPGAALPAPALANQGWVWVNFWAAWCAPCKEEIPRLKSWEARLKQQGHKFRIAFISLDDDERQLRELLASQPQTGLKSSLWLKEGDARGKFLDAAGLGEDPELPSHFLIDPRGKIRCAFSGAVEDSDYAALSEIVSGS